MDTLNGKTPEPLQFRAHALPDLYSSCYTLTLGLRGFLLSPNNDPNLAMERPSQTSPP